MVSPSDKQMLRDANGDLIPQYWDIVEQDFKPLTGQDGAQDTRLTGSLVEEVVVFKRDVYDFTGFRQLNIYIPQGVKTISFDLIIHGITGTFSKDEGYSASINELVDAPAGALRRTYTVDGYYTNVGNRSGLNITVGNVLESSQEDGRYKNYNGIMYPMVRINFLIRGDFAEGEGIDAEGLLYFFY